MNKEELDAEIKRMYQAGSLFDTTKDIVFTDYAYCINCKNYLDNYGVCIKLSKDPKRDRTNTCAIFELKENHNIIMIDQLANDDVKKTNYWKLRSEYFTSIDEKKYDKAVESLVIEFLKNNKVYTIRNDKETEMWIYLNGIYKPHGRSYITEFVRNVMGQSFSTQLVNKVIKRIESETFIEQDIFFRNEFPNLIPVQNGILDLRTRTLMSFSPDYIFFNKLPVFYDPHNDCPNIKRHIETVLKNKEDVKVAQELFGFLLWKEYFIEKVFMFVGTGRNGKGKTINIMERLLGSDNVCNVSLQEMERDQYCVSDMHNKMANLAGDINKTALKETGRMKELVGRDIVQANRKFLSRVKFVNYAKMVFCANEIPICYDLTDGFFTKIIIIEFPFMFLTKEEIENIKETDKSKYKIIDPDHIKNIITQTELSGLLNWAMDGLDRLILNKKFSYSKSTDEVKTMWLRKSNSFHAFCMDMIEQDEEGKIPKSEIRRAYCDYCKKHKLKTKDDRIIMQEMIELFGSTTERWRSETIDTRYWSNVKFKKEYEIKNDLIFSCYKFDQPDPTSKHFSL